MKRTITGALAALMAVTGLSLGAAPALAREQTASASLVEVQWRGRRDRDGRRYDRRWRGRRDNDADVAAAAVAAGIVGLVVGSAIAGRADRREYERGGEPAPYATWEEEQQDACRAALGPGYDPADGGCDLESAPLYEDDKPH